QAGAADLRGVRAAPRARRPPRPRVQPAHAPRGAVEERRLPRPADDRRACASPAREARGRAADTGVHPHGSRGRIPVPRPMTPLRGVGGRLALALLVVVIGVLVIVYLIVVPSYRSSLVNNELRGLSASLRSIVPSFPAEPYLKQQFASAE